MIGGFRIRVNRAISTVKLVRLAFVAVVLVASAFFSALCFLAVARTDGSFSSPDRAFVGSDFVVFYAGATLAAEGHAEAAYEVDALHAREKAVVRSDAFPWLPLVYPPSYLLALMPLTRLDYLVAYRVWIALALALLCAVGWRLHPHWQTLLLVPLYPAVAFCAFLGHNSMVSAAILGAGMLLLPRRPVAAGIVFGLMAYKPQLALAIPLCLVAGGHYRALAATAGSALATVLAGLLAFGTAPLAAFAAGVSLHSHLVFEVVQEKLFLLMPTVMSATLQATGSMSVAWGVHLAVAVVAAVVLVRVWRSTSLPGLRALAFAAATPLLTPYFLSYDLTILLVPLLLLMHEARTEGGIAGRGAVIAVLWLAFPIVFLLPLAVPFLARIQFAPVVWMLLLGYAAKAAATPAEGSTGGAGNDKPRRSGACSTP